MAETLQAAKMHNLNLKHRKDSYINAYFCFIAHQASEINNWNHKFTVIIDICNYEMSALIMNWWVSLDKILAK